MGKIKKGRIRPGLKLWFYGSQNKPPRFDVVAWIFLRGMGLIYLSAFVSFAVQAMGLIGSHGIQPLSEYVKAISNQEGVSFWLVPMLFWFDSSDLAIEAVCWTGAAVSLLLVFDILPRLSLLVLYVLYLSLFYGGQVFMSFQWDLLLLESGFLALFLSLTTVPGIWLLRWLLFRFMLLSGSVKLLSGDPTWSNLSALSYHFQTQPLPTPLAWYVHKLPPAVLTAGTVGTFIIELIFPLFIFAPRRLRHLAAFGFLLLEFLIFLTGNYTFFNLLTMLLCLALFDDTELERVIPARFMRFAKAHVRKSEPRKILAYAAGAFVVLVVCMGIIKPLAGNGQMPAPVSWVANAMAPLRIVNAYGLFAVMTTRRPEIIIEGSDDGINWTEYGFKYKPGDVRRPPLWNIPHQPRLDWQMWFAALGTAQENLWFANFLRRLLEGAPEVTALLENNPFAPPRNPPRYVRALVYDYRFSTFNEYENTGVWWVRQYERVYFPTASLKE